MPLLRVGQSVTLLNDDLSGVINAIKSDLIVIETEDGFLIEVDKGEVIPNKALEFDFNESDYKEILEQEENLKPKIKSKKQEPSPPMEVDLHIHLLVKNEKNMSAHDKLTLQVDTARGQLEFAIDKKIQRIIFIHGVGEGVLRMELEYLFSRYNNVRYYDADYKKYGVGATEVYVYQNP